MNRDELRAAISLVNAIDPQDLNRELSIGVEITLGELEAAQNLARAVLSLLDVPDEVKAAMGRYEKWVHGKTKWVEIWGPKHKGESVEGYEARCRSLLINDLSYIASHFLTLPIAKDDT